MVNQKDESLTPVQETALPTKETPAQREQPAHPVTVDAPEIAVATPAQDQPAPEQRHASENESGRSTSTHQHLQAGAHIRLAAHPPVSGEDAQRGAEIARTARNALKKYADYREALKDGYTIFAPDVPQDVYHFIKWQEVFSNLREYDPTKPTALLYEKTGQEYEWVGVMYSASIAASEAELDRRFPLSLEQWHAHVNICIPPDQRKLEDLLTDDRFGFEGSIDTQTECQAAGGRFMPDVLGWMVHVDVNKDYTALASGRSSSNQP